MKLTLFKIPLYWLFYYFGWPMMLPLNYTFSLTFDCNSRCKTCNVWKKKKSAQLTAGQWQKIFSSLGKSPYWVTLSGGEPFLRPDLEEIVKSLYHLCRPKIVNIPTNGLAVAVIEKKVARLTKACPKTHFTVNVSIDGVGSEHDRIRGIKGSFAKASQTVERLKEIKAGNLTVGVHTVISRFNALNFAPIANHIITKLKPDSYVTEIAEERMELDTRGQKIAPTLSQYQQAVACLGQNLPKAKFPANWTFKFRRVYYDLVLRILKEKKQILPCYAGIASAQIAPNGDVWSCCTNASSHGNLVRENYDFAKIWFGKTTGRKCFCTLANATYTNILLSPKYLMKVLLA